MSRFSQEEQQQITAEYIAGASCHALAAKYRTSTTTILGTVRACGGVVRPLGSPPNNRGRPDIDWKATGVYRIRNKLNGKLYIGSTVQDKFGKRWDRHLRELRAGNHHSSHLQHSWNKYGADAFEFDVIEYCDPAICLAREDYYMKLHRTAEREFGYNMNPEAYNCLGVKRTPEVKAKMSKSATGRKLDQATKDKIAAAHRGKKLSPEHRAKLSVIQSKLLTRRGTKHTPESIEKMRQSHRGKSCKDPTYLANLSARMKGNKNSLGMKLSEETKAKIGEASRKQWELIKSGQKKSFNKLTAERVKIIRQRLAAGGPENSQKKIAADEGVTVSMISAIAVGRAWKGI